MTLAQLPTLLVCTAIFAVCIWSFRLTLSDHRARIAPAAPTKPETPSAVVSERDGANGEAVHG